MPGLADPHGIKIHNNQINWVNTGTKEIKRVDLDGSNATTLVDGLDGLVPPREITIHNDQVYWTDDQARTIYRANLDGVQILLTCWLDLMA